jgi:hypothetical protein
MKQTSTNWFEVSREGLKELYADRAEKFVLRELIQNAWDEPITTCNVTTTCRPNGSRGLSVLLSVEDDSPSGFRNLEDAWTLFGPTYKRSDPSRRGRFNLGEKQVLAVCDTCKISSTKGRVEFDSKGRTVLPPTRKEGSQVVVQVSMTREQYDEMLQLLDSYLPPSTTKFIINGRQIIAPEAIADFEDNLVTEVTEGQFIRRRKRRTKVEVYNRLGEKSLLYEMGIPVQEIDCEFSLNVMQKVPLATDRESVPTWYLRDLFAVTLNHLHDNLDRERVSETWIRDAMESREVEAATVQDVMKKRFGGRMCVANPNDPQSVDEAISRGYNIVYGSEMSAAEWKKAKQYTGMQSSTALFGTTLADGEPVRELTDEQIRFADYAKMLARELLGIRIGVDFCRAPKATCSAQFGNLRLTVNLSRIPSSLFTDLEGMTDLILHEIGHYGGNHTEHSYHETLTRMGAKLLILALEKPELFKEWR